MKLFFSIIRWLIAIFASIVWYAIVVTIIPIQLFLGNFATREGATQFVTALTVSEETTVALREGIISGLANSQVTDPSLAQLFADVAQPTSVLGDTVRKVFTASMLRNNLRNNVTIFYDWLEGKNANLVLNVKLEGTKAQHEAILNAVIKSEYDALPECTEAELRQIMASPSGSETPTCRFVPYEQLDNSLTTEGFFSAPEYTQATTTGLPFDTKATASDREAIKAFFGLAQVGRQIFWVLLAIVAVIIWLLFTPRAISSIMTGILLVFTALTLYSEAAIIAGIAGVSTLSVYVGKLQQTANILLAIGVLLAVFGVYLLARKKKKSPAENVVDRRVEEEPVVSEISGVAKKNSVESEERKGVAKNEATEKEDINTPEVAESSEVSGDSSSDDS